MSDIHDNLHISVVIDDNLNTIQFAIKITSQH